MQNLQPRARHELTSRLLEPRPLSGPQVRDEDTLALSLAGLKTVAFRAGHFLDVRTVVVADEQRETTLVGRMAGTSESVVVALRVFGSRGRAIPPILQQIEGLVVLRDNHETGVDPGRALGVEHGGFAAIGPLGVLSDGDGVLVGVDLPVVHEPLDGHVEVVEDGITVDVDDNVVLFEELGDDGGFQPRASTVLAIFDLDVVVRVAVDLAVNPVVQRTHGLTLGVLLVVKLHRGLAEEESRLVPCTVVKIDDGDSLAHFLAEVRTVSGKFELDGGIGPVGMRIGLDDRLPDFLEEDIGGENAVGALVLLFLRRKLRSLVFLSSRVKN